MRTYRTVWSVITTCVLVVSLVGGGESLGWWSVLGVAAALAVLGASFALAVPRSEGGIVSVPVGAGCGGAVGVVLVGLPVLLGTYAILVLLALTLSAPALVGYAADTRSRRREGSVPERGPLQHVDMRHLPDDELTMRWLTTGARVRHPGCSPGRRLVLVHERGLVLDEIERRDPAGFSGWVSGQVWQVPQGR